VTPEILASAAGILLSLAFSYIPGLSTWYAAKDPTIKRLIMLAALVVVAAGVFGLSCAKVYSWVTCDQPGATGLVTALVLALVANQATFLISPQRSNGSD
jgi:hypothetical protein